MAEVPGVGAIVESIKARIAQIEEQFRQHGDLSDELERLRDALGRLERGVGERVRGRRARGKVESRSMSGAAKRAASTTGAATPSTRRRPAAAQRGQTRAKSLEALKDGRRPPGRLPRRPGPREGAR